MTIGHRIAHILGVAGLLGGIALSAPAYADHPTVSFSVSMPGPRVEVRHARPSPHWVWIEGYWTRAPGRWEWQPGYWMYAPPERRVYHPVYQTYGHYVYIGDRWDWYTDRPEYRYDHDGYYQHGGHHDHHAYDRRDAYEDRREYQEDRHEAWEDRQEYYEDRQEAAEDRQEAAEDHREHQEDRHDDDRPGQGGRPSTGSGNGNGNGAGNGHGNANGHTPRR